MEIKPAEPGIYRRDYPLAYSAADAGGYLRLTGLLDLLQTQAGDHTQSLGFDYREHRENGVFWVLSRLTARFGTWPEWPCTLTVDTWSRKTKALFALRDFRFGADESWFGRATTAWVLLKNGKPQRPEPWVQIYTQITPEEPAADVPAALPPFAPASEAEVRAEPMVRRSASVQSDWEDVDMNGHVNNVRAVGWCLAQHEFDFLARWRPAVLEVNFLAEMFCGQRFVVLRDERPSPEGSRTFDYLVEREDDQGPTLRMRITYR